MIISKADSHSLKELGNYVTQVLFTFFVCSEVGSAKAHITTLAPTGKRNKCNLQESCMFVFIIIT